MVEAAGIEPASVSSPPSALHAYFVYYLTFHWPGEQGLERRACFKFNCFRHKRGLAAVPWVELPVWIHGHIRPGISRF